VFFTLALSETGPGFLTPGPKKRHKIGPMAYLHGAFFVLGPAMISQIPHPERPRERCLRDGPSSLSLRELLALILNSGPPGIGCLGLSEQLLERAAGGSGTEELDRAFFLAMDGRDWVFPELAGLGAAARVRVMAAMELGRRYALFRDGAHAKASFRQSSADKGELAVLARVPGARRMDATEWLGFVPAYPEAPGQFCLVERGVRTHVNFDPAGLFARVLALRPRGFFLLHNHPSGDLTASTDDRFLTRQVADTASRLGVPLLGHCVIGPRGHAWIVL
jgi:DNA repair protein RadC